MKKSIIKSVPEILGITLIVFIVSLEMLAFLSAEINSGWDLTPQYYLYSNLKNSLKSFHLGGYDLNWFGGYPEFYFYGFIAYLIPAVADLLIFEPAARIFNINYTDSYFVFNFYIFLLPFIFLHSLYFASGKLSGKRHLFFTLLFGLLFLTSHGDGHNAPISIYSAIFHGHISSFTGLILTVYLIGYFESIKHDNSFYTAFITFVLLTSVIFTHSLSTAYIVFIAAVYSLTRDKKYFFKIFSITLLALASSLLWLGSFISNFEYSASKSLPQLYVPSLHWLFPELWRLRFIEFDSLAFIFDFPWTGVIFLSFSVYGIFVLIRKQELSVALSFLLCSIFLSGNFIPDTLNLPIHYYRFTIFLFPLMLLIALAGLSELKSNLNNIKSRHISFILSLILNYILFMPAIKLVYGNYLSIFFKPAHAVTELVHDKNYPKPLSQYINYKESQNILSYIKSTNPKGLIAAETSPRLAEISGSPHYFNTMLALNGLRSAIGLLAESSVNSSFIIPLISYRSESIDWGNSLYFDQKQKRGKSSSINLSSFADRLRKLNIEYIISTSKRYEKFLDKFQHELIEGVFRAGPFKLYKVFGNFSLINIRQTRPILYISDKGMTFLEFAKDWWKRDQLINYTIINTDTPFDKIPPDELSKIRAVIFSVSENTALNENKFSELIKLNIPVYIFGYHTEKLNLPKNFIRFNFPKQNMTDLFDKISLDLSPEDAGQEVDYALKADNNLEFIANGGCTIHISYFPNWKSKSESQTIYKALPFYMYVFSEGKTIINYNN